MLQDNKAVAYASKSLKSTKENCEQIEKELDGVLFSCKRFHKYIDSRKVVVEADHQPLEAILKKPLAAVLPWLQRTILQLEIRHHELSPT